jgi:thymidylate synthase
MLSYDTPSEAYLATLALLCEQPQYRTAPRGLQTVERLNHLFEVQRPSSAPVETRDPIRNRVIAEYTKREFELYRKGTCSVQEFAQASKFWEHLANPDGTINSAYGYLIFFDQSCGYPQFEVPGAHYAMEVEADEQAAEVVDECYRTPWDWAKRALLVDPDTRQAILKFHKREHLWVGNKDQVCTVYGDFLIRTRPGEDFPRLNFTVCMRSNDIVKGLVFDLPWFCYLMERMCAELLAAYPRLKLGTYTHFANSLHLYLRDKETVERMLGHTAELNLA